MMLRGFVVGLALIVALPATAQEKKRALVVPTELGGYFAQRSQWRYEYNRALENRLRSARFDVVKDALTPSEAECHEVDCLTAIANAHKVDVVVAARVQNNEQRLTSYALRVALVERTPGALPQGRSREQTCDNSTETKVRDELAMLLSRTLANEPVPESKPNLEPPPKQPNDGAVAVPVLPPAPPPVDPREVAREKRRKWIYRGTGIGLGAIGLLGVGQGIAEAVHNGDIVHQNGHTYRENTASGMGVFFGIGGAALVAGGVLSWLGWRHTPAKNSVTVTPSASPTGAHLQLEGTF